MFSQIQRIPIQGEFAGAGAGLVELNERAKEERCRPPRRSGFQCSANLNGSSSAR
jgi:hypothetical protein